MFPAQTVHECSGFEMGGRTGLWLTKEVAVGGTTGGGGGGGAEEGPEERVLLRS